MHTFLPPPQVKQGRNMRIRNLFNDLETIESALTTRLGERPPQLDDSTARDVEVIAERSLPTTNGHRSAERDPECSSRGPTMEPFTPRSSINDSSAQDAHTTRDASLRDVPSRPPPASADPEAALAQGYENRQPPAIVSPSSGSETGLCGTTTNDSHVAPQADPDLPAPPLPASTPGSMPPLASSSTHSASAQPSIAPGSKETVELTDRSTAETASTDMTDQAPTMTRIQAINIYFEAQYTKCTPETIQQAASMIMTHTPPLHLVRAAVLWASLHKGRVFNECPVYQKWAEANGVDLKEDVLEDVGMVMGE